MPSSKQGGWNLPPGHQKFIVDTIDFLGEDLKKKVITLSKTDFTLDRIDFDKRRPKKWSSIF